MSSFANQYAKPPNRPSSYQKPAQQSAASEPATPPESSVKVNPADQQPASAASDDSQSSQATAMRQQPIPPPSEPMQYRAIGLVRGRYVASAEQFTRGLLFATDGTEIDAVLLGRVMSLVKKHLDLEQEHLWVVYPRTREKDDDLHVQIVGVWEPEKLNNPDSEAASDDDQASTTASPASEAVTEATSSAIQDGYFSIRGEIIFHSPEQEQVVVKIQQSRKDEEAKSFKLKLKGALGDRKVVGYFWDLQVQRQADTLAVQEGSAVGMIPPKKRSEQRPTSRRRPDYVRKEHAPRGYSGPRTPSTREPLPKPIKRRNGQDTNS